MELFDSNPSTTLHSQILFVLVLVLVFKVNAGVGQPSGVNLLSFQGADTGQPCSPILGRDSDSKMRIHSSVMPNIVHAFPSPFKGRTSSPFSRITWLSVRPDRAWNSGLSAAPAQRCPFMFGDKG